MPTFDQRDQNKNVALKTLWNVEYGRLLEPTAKDQARQYSRV